MSAQFGTKNYTRKMDIIQKYFELYQVFVHNFLCHNRRIFPLYIFLTKRINIVWYKGIKIFVSESVSTIWAQKIIQEKSLNFKIFFWIIPTFYPQCSDINCRYLHNLYCSNYFLSIKSSFTYLFSSCSMSCYRH